MARRRMGETDRRTPDSCINPAPHTKRAVPINSSIEQTIILRRDVLRVNHVSVAHCVPILAIILAMASF